MRRKQKLPDGPIVTRRVLKKFATPLPDGHYWVQLAMEEPAVQVEVSDFLHYHYWDEELPLRYTMSIDFLEWMCLPPEYDPDFFLGVRKSIDDELVGMLIAVPTAIRVDGRYFIALEVRLLCVHRYHKTRRLAPILTRELNRLGNHKGYWQVLFECGARLPNQISEVRFYHRPLHFNRLMETKFIQLEKGVTRGDIAHRMKLPTAPPRPWTLMKNSEVPAVMDLLVEETKDCRIGLCFSEQIAYHIFAYARRIVQSMVLRDSKGRVTDFISYYIVPAIFTKDGEPVNAAYLYYTAATTLTQFQLVHDAIIIAKYQGLDVMHVAPRGKITPDILTQLDFGLGNQDDRLFLYNWSMDEVEPQDNGLFLI